MKRAFVMLLLLVACKSKAKSGQDCQPDETACDGKRTLLFCVDGKIEAAFCRGPDGCVAAGENKTRCDVRDNNEGDLCAKSTPQVCSSDGKARVECNSGKVLLSRCRGPLGCAVVGSKVECDRSIAEEGDACNFITASDSCTSDKKRSLRCKDGKFVTLGVCRGPIGCKHFDGYLSCDTTVGEAGDPCPPDTITCSTDKKSRLVCKAGKFEVSDLCRGPLGCHGSTAMAAECDRSIASIGDACTALSHACSPDQKSLLGCKDGKFDVETACAKSETCRPKGAVLACVK